MRPRLCAIKSKGNVGVNYVRWMDEWVVFPAFAQSAKNEAQKYARQRDVR